VRLVLSSLTLALLVIAGAFLASPVHAQARDGREISLPPPLPVRTSLWRRDWPTFSAWEGAATVAAGLGTGALARMGPPKEALWRGPILFDEAVRDGLRLDSDDGRRKVRSMGDLPYFAAPVLPMLVDPLLVAWLVRGDTKTALNLELMSLEAFSYSGLASFVSTHVSRRERPDSSECRRLHPDGKGCVVDTESFYSGHTTIAATSAGLVCANHSRLPLWGNPVADASACVLSTTAAVATGVSRIVSDRHYATDVLVGFGTGFGIGYAVPVLLHYSRANAHVTLSVQPGGPCTGACLRLSGSF
jgi:membrane-associated phospholipid phosphatase